MNSSNPDIEKIIRARTHRFVDVQYKIDLLRKTSRNDLITIIRSLLKKDKI